MILTFFLNYFQSSRLLVNLYLSRSLLQLESYQLFEYLVMLTVFEFLSHIFSMAFMNKKTTFSSDSISDKLLVSIILIALIKSEINDFSSLLPLIIEYFLLGTCSSTIRIVMVRGALSEDSCHSECMV